MSDYFHGEALGPSMFPSATAEKPAAIKAFSENPTHIPTTIKATSRVMENLKASFGKSITGLFAVGFCWVAKIVYLSERDGTLVSVIGAAHPSFIALEDAKVIGAAMCRLKG
ncbi:hypothetical protein NA57DRAFT_55327 [Rhizodiscina lignyota]|uniref:Uncharacterized protein n=1 Tax=Rhizodiscina lignyota TaxID=1504668 RepID=A0A9P4M646_9PEZI|nr:hypothetical protein NA57DRAFT_55327 [Rhizodiscina lignyota]